MPKKPNAFSSSSRRRSRHNFGSTRRKSINLFSSRLQFNFGKSSKGNPRWANLISSAMRGLFSPGSYMDSGLPAQTPGQPSHTIIPDGERED